MLVYVRRALVLLVAVGTPEPGLLPAIVLHVGIQGLLVGVTGVTVRTVIGHLARWPVRSFLVLNVVSIAAVVHVGAQDPQDVVVVGCQETSL